MVSILHAWQPYRRLHVAYGVMCLLLPLLGPLRGNIPLTGVHVRALLAPVTLLLHGAKTWQLQRVVFQTHLPSPFWRKANNSRELFASCFIM